MELLIDTMSRPLFSIIIASYNAGETFSYCLECVRRQRFNDFQLIIIDGRSNDNTIEIIEKNKDIVDFYLSEPDNGIYDAWNKGLKHANGEWILFVGADDYLLPDALNTYHTFLQKNDIQRCYYVSSKVQIIDTDGRKKRVFGWPWNWHTFKSKHVVAHPGSIHHHLLFKEYGIFDIRYKIAGDYEMLLRPKQKLNAHFINAITAEMTEGGISSNLSLCLETRHAQLKNKACTPIKANIIFLENAVKIISKRLFAKLGINIYLRNEFK